MVNYEVLGEIPPISYNEYMEQYGGTYEEFSLRSLAFMLQQQPNLAPKVRAEWEAKLEGINRLTGRQYEQ